MSESPPSFLQIEQSLPICCVLAATGGMLEVAATACTAVPSVRAAQSKTKSGWWKYLALAGNVTLQLIGSLTSHLVATWFGPVSMVVPFFYSSTLLCNMLIFGSILGLEFFTKTARTGTLVIVVAVILLPVVGPSAQEGQQITALIKPWYATLWLSLLLFIMTATGILIFAVNISKRFAQRMIILILLAARASSICINLTVSKGFVSDPSPSLFLVLLLLKISSGAIYTYAIVVQSTAIEFQSQFMPLNTTTIITINAITGILVWEDYKVMASWYGYACVFCLLGLGCELLLESEVLLLTDDNPDFGVHKRASMVLLPTPAQVRRSTKILGRKSLNKSLASIQEDEEGLLPSDEEDTDSDISDVDDEPMSRQNAWKYMLGIPAGAQSLHDSAKSSYGAIKNSSSRVGNAALAATAHAKRAIQNTSDKVVKDAANLAYKGIDAAQATGRQLGITDGW